MKLQTPLADVIEAGHDLELVEAKNWETLTDVGPTRTARSGRGASESFPGEASACCWRAVVRGVRGWRADLLAARLATWDRAGRAGRSLEDGR